MIGAGSIGVSSQGNEVILPDIDGTSSFFVRDSDNAPLFKVDSLGNVYTRKSILKIT